MLHATGIVPLSVHDSFIVPIAHKETLEQAMENAFPCRTAGVKIPCRTVSNLETCFSVPNQGAPENRTYNMGWSGGDPVVGGGGRPWGVVVC